MKSTELIVHENQRNLKVTEYNIEVQKFSQNTVHSQKFDSFETIYSHRISEFFGF